MLALYILMSDLTEIRYKTAPSKVTERLCVYCKWTQPFAFGRKGY